VPTAVPSPAPAPAEPPITWAGAGRTAGVTLLVFVLAGVLGGAIWVWVTDLPTYDVTRELPQPLPPGSVVGANFASDMSFLVIAAVGGLVCSLVCTTLFRRQGLVLLASVFGGALAASYLTLRTGTALGPPPLAEQAATAGPGDVLTYPLQVSATAVLVIWPLAAVIGVMLGVSLLTPVPNSAARDPEVD
jgi:hypothetical protein